MTLSCKPYFVRDKIVPMVRTLRRDREAGFFVLSIVLAVSAVGTILLFQAMDYFLKNQNLFVKEKDNLILNESTMSTFAIMEAALARRMWEPPPDGNCLKSEDFDVSGVFSNGLQWRVTAHYNAKVKNFEMIADGRLNGQRSRYKKYVKVIDSSDFLLFSGGTQTVNLARLYDSSSVTGLIAKDRRIYTKGPVSFYSAIDVPNPKVNFLGQPTPFPGFYGTILQGDRMQFVGGMYYSPIVTPEPQIPPESPLFKSMLLPFSNSWGSPDIAYGQNAAGVAVITNNYADAISLEDKVTSGVGAITRADVAANVYPVALFGGAPPLRSWLGVDTGAYFNNPDLSSIFYYTYGAGNSFGIRADYTCFSKPNGLSPGGKYCSYSESFPKGFQKWRFNAGLDGYLFTSDAEEIPSPKFNWDNLQALEEDANACGFVLSAHNPSAYKDCYVWDKNFLNQYKAGGGVDICGQVSPLDLDSITLNNFNVADLSDPTKKDLLLRRVLYLKVPTELKQGNPAGFMTGTLTKNTERSNLSIWVVNEDLLALKGVQPDTTSPLSTNPGMLRSIYFNYDAQEPNPALKKQPLSLVLMSPEQIHLLSPFYMPADYNYMQKTFPVVGGEIQPVRHARTDYLRQENDGFKYGFRKYFITNTTIISNSILNPSYPFYLRGLWSGPDSSAEQVISNLCMISKTGEALLPDGTNPLDVTSLVNPAYVFPVDANSPIPALTSNYYGGLTQFPRRYYPQVFWTQSASNSGLQESQVQMKGLRIFADFEPLFPPTKRNLTILKYSPIEGYYNGGFLFDLSHKKFQFNPGGYYFQSVLADSPCVGSNARYINSAAYSSAYDVYATQPVTNEGRHVFSQISPDNNYRNLGSLVGVEMPIIEVKK